MANDEGSGKDADMDRIWTWLSAYNRIDAPGSPFVPITHDQFLWQVSWTTYLTFNVGESVMPGSSYQGINLSFDATDYDFAVAKLELRCWAREHDTASADEEGTGYLTVYGANFFDNGGLHVFEVRSSDFAFDIKVWITRSWE
jgi:hypothetical protein